MVSLICTYIATTRVLAGLITALALFPLLACERPVVHHEKDQDGVVYTPLAPVVAQEGNVDIRAQEPAALGSSRMDAHTSECKSNYSELLKSLGSADMTSGSAMQLQPEVSSLIASVNSARRDAGVHALQPDPELLLAALIHAEDMARRGFFDHFSPEGCGLSHRINLATDFGAGLLGEVIARGQDSAAATLAAWLESPAHRRNLLDPRHRSIGLAVAAAPKRSSARESGTQLNWFWVGVLGKSGTDSDPPPAASTSEAGGDHSQGLRELLGRYQCLDGAQAVYFDSVPQRDSTDSPISGPPGCKGSMGILSAVTAEMRALCLKWGGGGTACSSDRWSEKMMTSARGTGLCPVGSSYQSDIEYCTEGEFALGPFPDALREHCRKEAEGNPSLKCLSLYMSKTVLETLLP